MPRLSKRENFLRLINKEVPEYIPTFNLFWGSARPPFMRGTSNPDGSGTDLFGVERVIDSGGINPAMPKTHDFILDDITKWRDVIKIPDFSHIDQSAWMDMAKQSIRNHDPENPYGGGTSTGFFQPLVAFMGFTEGLIACHEEPEEVKALMEYLCDFSVDNAKKLVQYYKPEYGSMGDDIAHERNPFLSLSMFQELIAPYWRRYYEVFVDAGLPVGHHNCGHFEEYLDDLVDMGVSFWDPVQSSNDEDAIKAKYGNNLALCAGPEMRFWDENTTEEQARTEVREYCDRLAPGGGFAMMDFIYADAAAMPGFTDYAIVQLQWVREEFDSLKFKYYE
ncbi:MAG: veratrol--corrinoid protein metyltransferase [Coriobacteriia bacterium]|nr:veratrol--corrinoid protein metyltransferase [Coriobacteriia bacterium]